MGNDAIAAALVHNYFLKHNMSDVVRIFESEASDVRCRQRVTACVLDYS
jgi:hypothetical protein